MAKKQNPKLKLVGFSTSVSNYAPFKVKNGTTPASKDCPEPLEVNNGSPVCQGNAAIDEDSYTKILAKSFKTAGLPTRFIVDTSRSGQSGIRKIWGSWCNVKGRDWFGSLKLTIFRSWDRTSPKSKSCTIVGCISLDQTTRYFVKFK